MEWWSGAAGHHIIVNSRATLNPAWHWLDSESPPNSDEPLCSSFQIERQFMRPKLILLWYSFSVFKCCLFKDKQMVLFLVHWDSHPLHLLWDINEIWYLESCRRMLANVCDAALVVFSMTSLAHLPDIWTISYIHFPQKQPRPLSEVSWAAAVTWPDLTDTSSSIWEKITVIRTRLLQSLLLFCSVCHFSWTTAGGLEGRYQNANRDPWFPVLCQAGRWKGGHSRSN